MAARRQRIVLAAAAIACVVTSSAAAKTPALSAQLLMERMVHPDVALKPLPFSTRLVMPSSHDRNGGNLDGGSAAGPVEPLGIVPPTFVRKEDGGYVLMEFHQPGCMVREYMAGSPPGETNTFGRMQVFIDGAATPSYDRPVSELFAGADARYPHPLTLDAASSSGGNYAMVPFCFAHSLKVRTTTLPIDFLGYWQADVLLAAPGTRVVPYNPELNLSNYAVALRHVQEQPRETPVAFSVQRDITAGASTVVARLRGAGTVSRLDFSVRPFDLATLNALRLQVTANGAASPQIDVPLASLFGDGIELRPIASKAFGMDPAKGSGYLRLPIPYSRGLRIALATTRAAHVQVDGRRGPRPPSGAGLLYGEHHVEHAATGADTRALNVNGSGRLVSLLEDDIDGGPVSGLPELQRFLEGDERVEIDGSRSPQEYGTGHEENYDGGYYYANGAYSGPFGGAGPLGSLASLAGTQSQYRVYADDGQSWSSQIAYGIEHGGGDEQPTTAAITTFSYRGPSTLRQTDSLTVGDAASEAAHGFSGAVQRDSLTAYFEGEHDGNSTFSTIVIGGSYYPAPAPKDSPESFTANGIRFGGPVSVSLKVSKTNRGVVLRGLFDQAPPLSAVAVSVDGKDAGIWASPTAVANPVKRWLEDDYSLPVKLTKGKQRIRVTLTAAPPAAGATLYGLSALSRSAP